MTTGHVYLGGRCCCGKREPISRRLLDSWSVSEDEPTVPNLIAAFAVFVLGLLVLYMAVLTAGAL